MAMVRHHGTFPFIHPWWQKGRLLPSHIWNTLKNRVWKGAFWVIVGGCYTHRLVTTIFTMEVTKNQEVSLCPISDHNTETGMKVVIRAHCFGVWKFGVGEMHHWNVFSRNWCVTVGPWNNDTTETIGHRLWLKSTLCADNSYVYYICLEHLQALFDIQLQILAIFQNWPVKKCWAVAPCPLLWIRPRIQSNKCFMPAQLECLYLLFSGESRVGTRRVTCVRPYMACSNF